MREQQKLPALLLQPASRSVKGGMGWPASPRTRESRTAPSRSINYNLIVKFLEIYFLGPSKDSQDNTAKQTELERAGCSCPAPLQENRRPLSP